MGVAIEIIFVSSDKDENSFNEYFDSMPWIALKFGDKKIAELKTKYQISGIPSLIFIDDTGNTLTQDGAERVYEGNINQVLDWAGLN